MLSSIRVLAWRVVEHGRRVLIQVPGHHLLTAPGNYWYPQTALQRYLLQQQALKKSISGVTRPRGQGGGSSSNIGCSNAVVPASPLVSLLGRIRPFVSDAVRRLSSASSRRLGSNRNSLYRDTAPLFALVGVTLVGYEREEDDCISAAAVNTRKQKGFLTREEELEAICGSIREAVFKSGWLYDDRHQYFGNETKNGLDSQQQTNIQLNSSLNQNVDATNATNTTTTTTTEEYGNNTTNGNYHANDCENVTNNNDLQNEGSLSNNQNSPCNNTKDNNHVYSLQDLDLSGVIDKGCNAVVYAARWKNSELEENSSVLRNNTTRLDATGINNSAEQIILHKINETHSTDDSSNNTSDTSLNSTANQNYHSNTAANLNETTNRSLKSHAYANSDLDLNINYNFKESSNNNHSTFDSNINSNFLLSLNLSGIEPPTNLDDLSSNPRQSSLSVLPLHGSTVSLLTQPSFEEASRFCGTRQSFLDQEQSYNLTMPDDNFAGRSDVNYGGIWNRRHCSNSLSEDVGRLLSSGGFGTPLHHKPHNKRVRFLTPSNNAARSSGMRHDSIDETMLTGQENDNLETNVMTDNRNASSSDDGRLPPSSAYPLAVKLVFNYEAASNAPAILSALYRELIPARSVQLDDLYSSWRNDFFGDASHQLLPYHPNIVDMQCAFVDRVPLLQGGMQLYPTALPPRLNPEGFGRNMSLFCVMRRYDVSLDSYLTQYPNPSACTSLLMMTQLLEALQHLYHHNICHRDLKPDNILLSLREGPETPWLVLTDFGCCLAATSKRGLSVPFISREAEPRQGNAALMAPEVKTARPGLLQFVNFSSNDIWAAGALAYQFYGFPNPFLKSNKSGIALDSGSYKESQLPGLLKSSAPAAVRRLVADLLRRRPGNRPSPTVAATLCQLSLWGPSAWLNRHSLVKPKHQQVMEWLLCLTTKVLCERRGSSSNGETEYRLVSTFLSRVRYTDVLQAIAWNRAF